MLVNQSINGQCWSINQSMTRFNPKTDEYERRAEKKQRAPAWCDRVLWRAPEGYVTQHTYGDCEALTHSDHRPVGSRFTVRPTLMPSTVLT